MGDIDRNELVRLRAYEIWESEGRPHGRDTAHWLLAEAELRHVATGAGLAETPPKQKTDLARKPSRSPKPQAKTPSRNRAQNAER
jgi:hypothetical protein